MISSVTSDSSVRGGPVRPVPVGRTGVGLASAARSTTGASTSPSTATTTAKAPVRVVRSPRDPPYQAAASSAAPPSSTSRNAVPIDPRTRATAMYICRNTVGT